MPKSILLACPKCDMATSEPVSYLEKLEGGQRTCEACGMTHAIAAMVEHGKVIRRKRGGRSLLATALRQSRERRELAAMVKVPRFDEPRTRGVSGSMLADAYTFPMESGTRLTVVYMGKGVLLQVVNVVTPDEVFEGKVLEINQAFAPLGELIVGDTVRFKRCDVNWIDAPTKSQLSCEAQPQPSGGPARANQDRPKYV